MPRMFKPRRGGTPLSQAFFAAGQAMHGGQAVPASAQALLEAADATPVGGAYQQMPRGGIPRPPGGTRPGVPGGTYGLGPVQNIGTSTLGQWMGIPQRYGDPLSGGPMGMPTGGGATMNRPEVSHGGMMARRRAEYLARRSQGRQAQGGVLGQGVPLGQHLAGRLGQSQMMGGRGQAPAAMFAQYAQRYRTPAQAQAYQRRGAARQGGYGYYSPQNVSARRGAFNQYQAGRRTFGDRLQMGMGRMG
jgi:hypothetical protein